MRIGLGAEALSPQLTGIGRYTWELATRLPGVAGVTDVKLFRDNEWHRHGDQFLRSIQPTASRVPRKLKKWLGAHEFARRLFHGPNFFFPPQAENAVITVHDLSVFRFPETHPIERLNQFEKEFCRSIDKARHIITDTHYIRQELTELFGVDATRMTAVPLGVSEEFFEVGDNEMDAALLDQYGLRETRYCLCVATIEPRKGLDHAVKAFLRFRQQTRDDAILVIVGASGWNNSELHQLFEDAAAMGAVKFLGFVTDPSLRAIYRNCRLFLYPSLYEGFGLPVLEAMASGIPVLTSNRSCLPEVSGGVAASVDVGDHEAFGEAIAESMQDETWRSRAIEDGLALARRFNWARCAEETVDVYRKLQSGYVPSQSDHRG